LRVRLLQNLGGAMASRDTPRGLVVTVPESDFRGEELNPAMSGRLARVAEIVTAHPGLFVTVEGNTDTANGDRLAYTRMLAVRDALVRAGVPANSIGARNAGTSRPVASNATADGRMSNRRVEITISGDPIGSVPYWDRTYPLVPRQ
jgi:outer membrane protein OmpA-like peptidoglycan-associated protein